MRGVPLLLGTLGTALVLGAATLVAIQRQHDTELEAAARAFVPAPVAPAKPTAPELSAPSLDISRVDARGNAVAAGRAEPGSTVLLLDNGREIGRARADVQGMWVILPEQPLPPGAHLLSLRGTGRGGPDLPGSDSAVVMVAEPPGPGTAGNSQDGAPSPLVVLLPPSPEAALRVLQGGAARQLGLDVVDYGENGAVRFAGTAQPHQPVRLYLDGTALGDALADASGHWTLVPGTAPSTGRHVLRLDQLAANGAVANRVELPFQRDSTAAFSLELANGRTVVRPGATLWRIAQQVYGQGNRYTEIFRANREQIRDPNRIYPGQTFSVPSFASASPPGTPPASPAAGPAAPTASSVSR